MLCKDISRRSFIRHFKCDKDNYILFVSFLIHFSLLLCGLLLFELGVLCGNISPLHFAHGQCLDDSHYVVQLKGIKESHL